MRPPPTGELALAYTTVVVRDYDEAIAWFVDVLGFTLLEDSPREGGKRWVVVRPSAGRGAAVLLARAAGAEQEAAIGRAAGGRVAYFLHTDDFAVSYARFRARGVEFTETPRDEPYGRVVVFRDLYGNRWDLIEPRHVDATIF